MKALTKHDSSIAFLPIRALGFILLLMISVSAGSGWEEFSFISRGLGTVSGASDSGLRGSFLQTSKAAQSSVKAAVESTPTCPLSPVTRQEL